MWKETSLRLNREFITDSYLKSYATKWLVVLKSLMISLPYHWYGIQRKQKMYCLGMILDVYFFLSSFEHCHLSYLPTALYKTNAVFYCFDTNRTPLFYCINKDRIYFGFKFLFKPVILFSFVSDYAKPNEHKQTKTETH